MHSPLLPDPVGPPALADQAVPASAALSGPDAASGGEVAVPVPAAVETAPPIDRAPGAPGAPGEVAAAVGAPAPATPASEAAAASASPESAMPAPPADLPPRGAPLVTRSVDAAPPPPDAPR